MKTISNFLRTNPSYVKCGAAKIAKRLKLSLNTVERYKRSAEFKTLNSNYRNSL